MTAPRLAILAAAFVLSAAGAAAGQRATAGLERIERADVDALAPSDADDDQAMTRQARVCLETGGAFVPAFRRYADSAAGYASVNGADDGDSLAWVALFDDSERTWTWHSFTAAGCVTVTVYGGRARVYRLTVGVNW